MVLEYGVGCEGDAHEGLDCFIGLFSGWFVGRAAGGVGSGVMVVGRR